MTLSRKHRNENRQLCVSISSTERPLLEWVLKATGVGKITSKRVVSQSHAASFTYAVTNRQALSLLKQTQNWLKTYKRTRAELVLENYVKLTPRNGRYSDELKRERTVFVRKVLSTRP